MHDEPTDTNGGDLKAIIRIVPPGNKTNGADVGLDIKILPPEPSKEVQAEDLAFVRACGGKDDDDDAKFAAELGRRARRRQIELGEL